MEINNTETYIVYGLSLDVQNLITSSMNQLKSHSTKEVFDTVNNSSLSQEDKNLVIFEIGRKFERSRYVRG